MEVLTLLLKRKVRLSDSFRYHKHCEDLQLINVCFADDLFIFARGEVDYARIIMEGLDEFKLSSGLVPSNGEKTSLWYDTWCSHCPLSNFLSHRDITNEGFNNKTCVAELVSSKGWQWPQTWLLKAPDLGIRWQSVPVELGGALSRKVWFSTTVSSNMPSIMACYEEKLQTQDYNKAMGSWSDVDISLGHARPLADMDVVPSTAHDIVFLTKIKRPPEEIRDLIMVTVRLKLVSLRFKSKDNVNRLLDRWKMPRNFRLYGN
ncbi:hypothetical protein Tco_0116644 [Tanacetum coccineum]